MADQLGTVITGGIGLIGVLAGIYVGRWQVTHQARVEHGQWLRGQRQEAYVALLGAWDSCVKEFQEMVGDMAVQLARHLVEQYSGDGWAAHEEELWSQIATACEPVRRKLERVELLGPDEVDRACGQLSAALAELERATSLRANSARWPDMTSCEEAWARAETARTAFLSACRVATRSAPAPRRQRVR
ncbi:hypothetical protein [Streptomyces sp. SPB4]|uniref:hypothetical protein n=1 Tax=Streptomyces sp. SPB4 TaxID=2940553 RepID=UPI0024738A30|nr:hypothetical protein [Streptomyces sp. SPB4]MDH6544949.1 hypothetical protein [Streptomyces sp. SPB4]